MQVQVHRATWECRIEKGFHVGGCSDAEWRSFVDCACTCGFHEQSHSKLGMKLTVHLLFESLWESPPDSQERVGMGGYRATKK